MATIINNDHSEYNCYRPLRGLTREHPILISDEEPWCIECFCISSRFPGFVVDAPIYENSEPEYASDLDSLEVAPPSPTIFVHPSARGIKYPPKRKFKYSKNTMRVSDYTKKRVRRRLF